MYLCFVAVTNCQNDDTGIKDKIGNILSKYKDECLEQSKTDSELVDQLLVGVPIQRTEELKCYVECALKKSNFIDENLKLISDTLQEIIPVESATIVDEIIKKCENVGSDNNCSKAYEMLKCVFGELKTKFNISG
ncbi:hypothetical protein FQR65_LT07122 [Abscondita terminalis]|nr:hypothetical protein FQR65_LT07122 [Abscondita terminalis]